MYIMDPSNTITLCHSPSHISSYIFYGYMNSSDFDNHTDTIDEFFNICHDNYHPYVLSGFNINHFGIITFIDNKPTIYTYSQPHQFWDFLVTLPHIIKQIHNLKRNGIYLCRHIGFELELIQKISSLTSKVKIYNKFTIPDIKSHSLTDLWCLHKRGGLISINSSSGVDLIKIVITYGRDKDHIDGLVDCIFEESYLEHTYPTICHLTNLFNRIQQLDAIPTYVKLYEYYSTIDTDYYVKNIDTFKLYLTDFFAKITSDNLTDVRDIIINFISKFKSQISIELAMVYHWLRLRPQTRIQIYRRFPNHPYIQLIKLLHKSWKEQSTTHSLDAKFVYAYLTAEPILTGNITPLLFEAVKFRHQLFNIFIEFKDSQYLPFKIFFDKIFLMEHLFNLKP